MNSISRFLTLPVGIAVLVATASGQLPELTPLTVTDYQQAIEPTSDEAAFLEIEWQTTLGSAVAIAHESDKPLMIYVMNGHPLGCT